MDLNKNISISFKELNHLFPFFLILNQDLKIESFGKSMSILFPEIEKNDDFTQKWNILRPWIDINQPNYIETILGKLVVISNMSNSELKFKGQFEKISSEGNYIFLGSPWFNDTDQLIKNNLTISDFALHDSMTDLLHVLKNNEIANFELNEILTKINDQKKTLEKDKNLLLKKEKMFQALAESTEILISKSDTPNAITEAFSIIGKAIDLNKISIFQNKKLNSFKIQEWEINNENSEIKYFEEEEEITHPYFQELSENKMCNETISTIEERFDYKKILNNQNIKSILIIPIFCKNIFWGFIEYKDCQIEQKRSIDEQSLLKSFTNSIASVIENNESTNEIYNMALFSLENPDPVIRIDKSGNVLLRNEAAKALDYLVINGKQRNDDSLFKLLSKKLNTQNNQLIFEGKHKELHYQIRAILSENNKNINIYLSNISKQKTAEINIIKANESLKIFQSLINNSSDSIQVSNEDGQLIYINNAASESLGIPIDKCSNYNIKDIETLFQDETVWKEHIEELKNNDFITLEGENTNQKTGIRFPLEVTVKYIIIEEKGYIIANLRDITERKKNENRLKFQEEKYRNIIANMNLGLLEVDLNENIQFCNQSFTHISGYELPEIIGTNASSLFYNIKNSDIFNLKRTLRENGISDSYEAIINNKQNEQKCWLISGAPNYNDKGEVIGTIGIHLDITAQKMLEKELEKALITAKSASIAKEAFLANMSHEIRTPLNGIIGMIRELNKEDISPKQQTYVESAQIASKHLLSIINNILDLSKIEARELKLDSKVFNLNELIFDVKKILETETIVKGINLELFIDPKLSNFLIGDETRIRQILINIIGNSIKFTEEGSVKIECKVIEMNPKTQEISIKISDTGIGMKDSYLNNIFTKFHQEDISSSRKYGGSGLGMFITKELIDLMGGEINISSQKKIGTEVLINITLPISQTSYKTEVDTNIYNLKNKLILLVEDNKLNRLVATKTLAPYQMTIIEVENGKEAIEVLKNQQFDLILMDLQMPIMGGLEATKIIREKLKINTPIVGLSANAFKTEIENCLMVGMNNYVTKPFEETELIKIINSEINFSKKNIDYETDLISEKSTIPSELYNLKELKKISRGDDVFVQKMLNLFVETTPILIEEMKSAFKNKDYNSLKRLAHKFKPIIDNLGIESLKEQIRHLENLNHSKANITIISVLVIETTTILSKVNEHIKQNELK